MLGSATPLQLSSASCCHVPTSWLSPAGMHAEGGIWATLFGLLMWDILFLPIPEVFRTPFQTAPLDLGTVAFYPARADVIRSRLQEVRAGSAPACIRQCWQSNHRQWCRGVNWDRYGEANIGWKNRVAAFAMRQRCRSEPQARASREGSACIKQLSVPACMERLSKAHVRTDHTLLREA